MPEKLPYDIFMQTFAYVPRVALNLVITNAEKQVLLTKRSKPSFVDAWHFPGSFLLKDESLPDCLSRIAREELGIGIVPTSTKLLGVFEDRDKDARGHVIDIMYGYELVTPLPHTVVGDTKEMNFFTALPEPIGFNHRDTLSQLGFK
jgi:8-oxo-dGTP diphosphatase